MNGNDGARAGSNRGLDAEGINVAGGHVRFDRHQGRSYIADSEPSRDVGVRGHDDLVTLANPPSAQHQMQRFQPVADPDTVADAAVLRKLLLESPDFLVEDVPS